MTMGVVRPCSGIPMALGMHSKATVGIGLHQHGWHRLSTGRVLVTHALGDSKNSKDSSKNSGGLKREEEPEEYWSSERERKGESPFKDPLAVIGMVSIMFPFIFLVIASSLGIVDLSPR